MEAALIGLLGAILGIILSEFLRRRRRAEALLDKTFQARLDAYGGLASIVGVKYGEALAAIKDPNKTAKQVWDVADECSYEIAKYCDLNILQLDDHVCQLCVDILEPVRNLGPHRSSTLNQHERDSLYKRVVERYEIARACIKDHSGVSGMEDAMRDIAGRRKFSFKN